VVDRTGASKNHNRLVTNLIVELHRKLDAVVWSITACYMAVEIGDNVRFPDVVVERLDAPGSELVAGQPAVLVEVLSPSSVARHMRIKAAGYLSLSQLLAYIVASQDGPRLWVWQRDEGRAFAAEPVEILGHEETLTLAALGVALPLAGLYRAVAG